LKVRLRNDHVQLICDQVRQYAPEKIQEEEPITAPPAETRPKNRQLRISITQTTDEESDIAYLRKLVDTLRGFPGEDEVNLSVANEDRIINLKLSNICVKYCPELHQRLVEMVGEEGLELES